MNLTCTVSHLANGKWLARHSGASTGRVEVTAPTREEALTKMRDELQYRSTCLPLPWLTPGSHSTFFRTPSRSSPPCWLPLLFLGIPACGQSAASRASECGSLPGGHEVGGGLPE